MDSLPTVTNNTTFEQIASLIGQDVPTNGGGPSINLLKINRDNEDDNGRSIPAGSFFVNLPEGTVYAKTIKFQLFMQRYQYMHYDAEANEMVSKSILAKNLYPQTEIPDTIGTMRCGSVPAAQRDSLSAEQALKQKDIKCFRMLYGKVTFNDAVDADGKSVEVADLPVLWRARGSNFMPISKPLDALSAQKKPFIFFNLNASLNRQKNGGLVYYVSDLSIGDGPLDFTEDDQGLLKFFDENITSENKQIMADHDKALRMSGDVIDADSLDASIDSALNDDLPESLTA
jgi:hypothetical protein|tara:strand:- start:4725 stop:5585 length:861 start_codon:yes stop_codon:yes gene_type:complete